MKIKKLLFIPILLILIFGSYYFFNNVNQNNEQQELITYVYSDLKYLENTDIFDSDYVIRHIFVGTINSNDEATGYHYDMIVDSYGSIIEGTKSKEDKNGVYSAQIKVKDIYKTANNGYSTFFPDYMSPQEVVDLINEAYENKQKVRNNTYRGLTKKGIVVEMYINDNGLIASAYPIKED